MLWLIFGDNRDIHDLASNSSVACVHVHVCMELGVSPLVNLLVLVIG